MKVSAYIKKCVQEGTQFSKFNILAAALLGAPAHLFFYFVFKYGFHLPYESLSLRLMATVLSVCVLFGYNMTDSLKKVFPVFWHFVIIFVLPFIFTLNLLKNNFHELWLYWEIFMIFILISFVPNWLMFLIDFLIGVLAAIVFYLLTTPVVDLDPQFNIPLYTIVVVFTMAAGYLFSFSNRKGMVAQEKNHALQALAGSIAHEMRNPLGQVKYSFDSILQELPIFHPGAPAECISSENLDRVYLRVAQGQMAVNRGVQVIEMILDEVKNKPIDTKGFTLLSAAGVTRKALDEYGYESDAERKKISFDCREDFLINADETMYVFVLFNLIMNAFYFIKPYPEGRIIIRQEKGEKHNRIYVRDTGPGIPSENIDKLFNPFFTSGKKGGTGLGLAYCKRVMKAFGGDITCNSVYGSYTEFLLSFPFVSDDDLAEFRKNMADRYLELFRDKRILLVDDEVPDRGPVKNYLGPFEVEVDEAGDGLEALEKVKGRRYDAVLMNLSMPNMNGYEATEAIRSGQAGALSRKVPIIGHTAAPNYIARGKTEKIGMQGFISKPFSEPELIELLGRVFRGHLNGRSRDLSGVTVMLVDDSSFNRLAFRGILEKCNIRVIEAVNGTAAIAKVREEHCDLILMDIQMPELDGVETTRIIRARNFNGNRSIPIIGLSGESDEEYIEEALDAGMNDYLHKPVNSALLLSKIDQWIVS